MSLNDPDRIDRLYDRIELENPPPNFTGRLMARLNALRRIQRVSAALSLAGLALLGVCAFALGRGLTISGVLDTLGLLLGNLDVAGALAGDFAAALLDAVPWLDVAAVAVAIAVIAFVSAVLPRWLAARMARTG